MDPIRPPSWSGLVGAARRDVTPPEGIYFKMWGAATYETAAGVHRPLTATALALRPALDGEEPLVLVAIDLTAWQDAEDERLVREAIVAALGVDPRRVVVNLSHTHAGLLVSRENADKTGGALLAPYLERLCDEAAAAAVEAVERAETAVLEGEAGWCALAWSRDLPDGLGAGANPAVVPDRTLLVGRVTADSGRTLATIANYACHPTTLAWQNQLISPDYVGAARELVEADTGAPLVFLQGASGELAPREQYTGDTEVADRNGRMLGRAVLATLEAMLPPGTRLAYDGIEESGAPLALWRREPADPPGDLAVASTEVEVELKPLEVREETARRWQSLPEHVRSERIERWQRLRRALGEGDSTTTPLYAWRLGDALLVATPTEPYSYLQVELRRRLAPHPVVVLGVANGVSTGYLPPAGLYDRDLYQVWQSPYAAGSLERLVDAAEALLRGLLA